MPAAPAPPRIRRTRLIPHLRVLPPRCAARRRSALLRPRDTFARSPAPTAAPPPAPLQPAATASTPIAAPLNSLRPDVADAAARRNRSQPPPFAPTNNRATFSPRAAVFTTPPSSKIRGVGCVLQDLGLVVLLMLGEDLCTARRVDNERVVALVLASGAMLFLEETVKFERNKLSGRKWVHMNPKEGQVLHPVYAAADARAELC